ncbi:MAG: thiosulfate/3-mercaptopyruvate sulfurtransferase [Chloroflexi bacterium]|jgi:thiosulfate/3-mercaptopyruvate sulfurtransferase|nr:MAG: thiosulfate/3-mercaptopyruvate sulfurtransferase [Chloroflexota bacterium]
MAVLFPAAPDLIAETDWLAENLQNPKVRTVDMGWDGEFDRAHIPGAVRIPHPYIKGVENSRLVVTPEEAKSLFESLGIGDDSIVVGYDHNRIQGPARLWWVLTYYGHSNVKVLNGGWRKWVKEGRPIELTAAAAPSNVTFTPRPDPTVLATVEELVSAIGQPGVGIWDARTSDEFVGRPGGNARGGHVPGATNLEWSEVVDPDEHTFKSLQEIQGLVSEVGLSPDQRTYAYCQAAVRGAHAALTLKLLGYPDVRLDDGSMGEWANREDTPLVEGS